MNPPFGFVTTSLLLSLSPAWFMPMAVVTFFAERQRGHGTVIPPSTVRA
jgi:hypothetical protein